MEILVVSVIVVVALMIALGYLSFVGWRRRLDAIHNEVKEHAGAAKAFFFKLYNDEFLRLMRQTKWVSMSLVVLIGASAFFIHLPALWVGSIVALSLIVALCIFLVEREDGVEEGRVTIAAGNDHADVVLSSIYGQMPIIRVVPFDPANLSSLEGIRSDRFTIRLDSPATTDVELSWRVASRPEGFVGMSIFGTAIVAFSAMASLLFAAGLANENREAIALSLVPAMAAVIPVFVLIGFFVWVAQKAASIGEFFPNLMIELCTMAAKRDFSGIDAVMQRITNSSQQVANAFNQEEWKVLERKFKSTVVLMLSTTYVIALLWPSFDVFVSVKLVELVSLSWFIALWNRAEALQREIAKGDVDRIGELRALRARITRMATRGMNLYIGATTIGLVALLYQHYVTAKYLAAHPLKTHPKNVIVAFDALIQNLFACVAGGETWIAGHISEPYMAVVAAGVLALFGARWLSLKGEGGKALSLFPKLLAAMALLMLGWSVIQLIPDGVKSADDLKERVHIARDKKPPVIIGVSVINLTESSSVVRWMTNEDTSYSVEYNVGPLASRGMRVSDASFHKRHEALLTDLTPGTSYVYRIHAVDQASNETVSADTSFVSLAPPTVEKENADEPSAKQERPSKPSEPVAANSAGMNPALTQLCTTDPDLCP